MSVTTSFCHLSGDNTSFGGEVWSNPTNPGNGLAANTGFIGDADSSSYIYTVNFTELDIPASATILGVNFLVDLFNGDGPLTASIFSYLTFDGGATRSGTVFTRFWNYEDGTDFQYVYPDRNGNANGHLWGLTAAQVKAGMGPDFGLICAFQQEGADTTGMFFNRVQAFVYYQDSNNTFRDRGGGRGRLLWGVR